jgi:hypothetical protein
MLKITPSLALPPEVVVPHTVANCAFTNCAEMKTNVKRSKNFVFISERFCDINDKENISLNKFIFSMNCNFQNKNIGTQFISHRVLSIPGKISLSCGSPDFIITIREVENAFKSITPKHP